MDNAGFATIFREFADYLELKKDNPFKIRAYRRAADIFEDLNRNVAELALDGELKNIQGIGTAIEEKAREIASSGKLGALEDLKLQYPPGVMEMTRIPGVGLKTASRVFHELGIAGIDQLEAAAEDGRLEALPGMGKKTAENILKGITRLRMENTKRIPLVLADRLSKNLMDFLRSHMEICAIAAVGSLRRRKETCGDLDILVSTEDPSPISGLMAKWNKFSNMISSGEDRIIFTTTDDIEVDIIITVPEKFPFDLFVTTGSKSHYTALESIACELGYRLRNNSFTSESGKPVEIIDEADIYKALKMEYIPPELREMTGEIEAALKGSLPKLLIPRDIRGDLHMHTNWSDGTSSIESMVYAAKNLGYEYIAITDHSESLKIAKGLSKAELSRQMEVLERLRTELDGIQVLSGIELEILKDGSLDYDDSILSSLDLIIASVHSAFGQPKDVMTARIVKAIRSGRVDIIAHPTGRVLGRRFGYDVDLDVVIKEAAKHNVALEINSYPERMDLDSTWARKAAESGVYIAINSDAHNVEELKFISYGLDVARRAWLEQADVINTWPISKFQAWLSRRRIRA